MNTKSIKQLWNILHEIVKGVSSKDICVTLNMTDRQLQDSVARIRRLGIGIDYSRKNLSYATDWAARPVTLNLSDYEFFHFYVSIKTAGNSTDPFWHVTHQKLQKACEFNSAVLLDLSAGDLSNKSISDSLQDTLKTLSRAIRKNRVSQFLYTNSHHSEIRTVHPYLIIHSQHSFYVWAHCVERQQMRFFKVIRIKNLKVLAEPFVRMTFAIEEELHGAWYIRSNKFRPLFDIKVRFVGEAAQAIAEYKLHHSQNIIHRTDEETLVKWQLTDLSEFSSWLCQWLGSFTILSPPALQEMVDAKVSAYQTLKKGKQSEETMTKQK